MPVLRALRNCLVDPRLSAVDLGSADRFSVHKEILSERAMMKSVFLDFYKQFLEINRRCFNGNGSLVEIGSGVSFFKSLEPKLVVTDIVDAPGLDMVLDAQNMSPLEDSSVRAIFASNCFHHLSEPRKFFQELRRVLNPGGGVALIEPYYGPVARPFYRNLHSSESFDMNQKSWNFDENKDPNVCANQALAFLVFVRDRKQFEQEFPDLEIVELRPLLNYPRYLLSGGLNFKQLLPDWSIPYIRGMEFILAPFAMWLGLHFMIVLRKKTHGF